jgi:hypothetical protein
VKGYVILDLILNQKTPYDINREKEESLIIGTDTNASFILLINYMSSLKNVGINISSCAVWVRNLVSHFGGGTQTEGF